MTKSPIPLQVADLTGFTRALARQLGPDCPSHLTLMNMVARAAGFQNVQHMRADLASAKRLERTVVPPLADARTVEKALHQFDARGRLRQWPGKRAVQTLALWALWAAVPARVEMTEKEINTHLEGAHLFQDPATLRRTMISCGMLTRKPDGTEYRRIEQDPPPEARALIAAISARRVSGQAQSVSP